MADNVCQGTAAMYPPLPLDPAQLAYQQLLQLQQQQSQLRLPAYASPMPQPFPVPSPVPIAPYAPAQPPPLPPPLPRQRRQRAAAAAPFDDGGSSLWTIVVCLVLGAAAGAACEKRFHACTSAVVAGVVP